MEETADQEGSYVWDENGELAYSDTYLNSELSEMERPTYWIYSVVPMLCPKTPSSFTMDVQFECAEVWDRNADAAKHRQKRIAPVGAVFSYDCNMGIGKPTLKQRRSETVDMVEQLPI